MNENPTPEYLYKIVSDAEWKESQLKKHIVNTPIDKGFVHLAKETQVAQVAQKFWKDQSYVILKLDSKKLKGRLVYETNPGGTTMYYHLYEGNIPLDAVVDVNTHKN